MMDIIASCFVTIVFAVGMWMGYTVGLDGQKRSGKS